MPTPRSILVFLISALLALESYGAQDTLRILHLGNSLASAWGPAVRCGQERGIPIKSVWIGYHYSVENGWNNATSQQERDAIRSTQWDYVSLQCFGTAGLDYNPDTAVKYVRIWDAYVDSAGHGAQLVLYHPWPTTGYSPIWDSVNGVWKPDSLDKAMGILRSLCSELSVYLLPVCAAQWEVQKRDPSIRLFADWIHGSDEANYLGGMVMFCALTGQDPRGLGNYNNLPVATAHFLQQIAWQTVVRPDILPSIRPWTRPPLADGLTLFTRNGASTVEQYLAFDVLGLLHKTDGSVTDSSNNLLFRSLTPDLLSITHLGRATPLLPGTALIEARAANVTDTLPITVSASTARYDSLRIAPHVFTGYVLDGFQLSATGYAFHQAQFINVDFTQAAEWVSNDSSIFTVVKGRIMKHTAQAGRMWVTATAAGQRDSIAFDFEPELRSLIRINFQVSPVSPSLGWCADNGQIYSDSLGYGWVAPQHLLGTREDRNGNFLLKSFVLVNPESEYKINLPDGDHILKIAMGDNVYGSFADTGWVRFGSDTLIRATGKTNTIKIDTIRVYGSAGIHLFIKGSINYLVDISSQGVDINDVSMDDGSVLPLALPSSPENRILLNNLSVSPNPFNPKVKISYALSPNLEATCRIFNLRGQMLYNADLKSGPQGVRGSLVWDGKDFHGRQQPSGCYLGRLVTRQGNALTAKLVMMK